MSKAEERYLEYFQDGRIRNCSSKEAFLLGYKQAEKDLELTWKDIRLMSEIGEKFMNSEESDTLDEEEYYTEILNKFKAQKRESA